MRKIKSMGRRRLTQVLEGLQVVRRRAEEHRKNGGRVDRFFCPVTGICSNLEGALYEIASVDEEPGSRATLLASYWMDRGLLVGWQHYSGDSDYPVPDPDGKVDPSSAYLLGPDLKWKGNHGDLRMGLLAYLIAEIGLELDSRGAA